MVGVSCLKWQPAMFAAALTQPFDLLPAVGAKLVGQVGDRAASSATGREREIEHRATQPLHSSPNRNHSPLLRLRRLRTSAV